MPNLKLMSTNRVAERIQSHASWFPPPIAFVKSKRASAKHEILDFHEFKMKLYPSDTLFLLSMIL
jgi:hypothetical protein